MSRALGLDAEIGTRVCVYVGVYVFRAGTVHGAPGTGSRRRQAVARDGAPCVMRLNLLSAMMVETVPEAGGAQATADDTGICTVWGCWKSRNAGGRDDVVWDQQAVSLRSTEHAIASLSATVSSSACSLVGRYILPSRSMNPGPFWRRVWKGKRPNLLSFLPTCLPVCLNPPAQRKKPTRTTGDHLHSSRSWVGWSE